MERHSRREFVTRLGCGAMSVAIGAGTLQAAAPGTELDRFIEAEMQAQKIPGLAACIVKSGKITWSKGYGWADIKRRVAMDPEQHGPEYRLHLEDRDGHGRHAALGEGQVRSRR